MLIIKFSLCSQKSIVTGRSRHIQFKYIADYYKVRKNDSSVFHIICLRLILQSFNKRSHRRMSHSFTSHHSKNPLYRPPLPPTPLANQPNKYSSYGASSRHEFNRSKYEKSEEKKNFNKQNAKNRNSALNKPESLNLQLLSFQSSHKNLQRKSPFRETLNEPKTEKHQDIWNMNLKSFTSFDSSKKMKFDRKDSGKRKSVIQEESEFAVRVKTPSFLTERFKFSSLDKNKFPQKQEIHLNKKLKLEDFVLGKCKGEGRFGKVFAAVHKETGFLFALKKVKKESVTYMLDQFIQEIKLQQYVSHPNVVKIYGYFSDFSYFYLLLEYMEEGSLYSLLKKEKIFKEPFTSQTLYQICKALKYMHSRDIIHRDLKPENIVISHSVHKICDFGWAAICDDRRDTYCGTLDYVCPEIIDGKSYDKSIDIWCIGVMAYQMLVGKPPFYDISRKKTMQKISNYQVQSFPSHVGTSAKHFINFILQKTAKNVEIEDILAHPFFDEGKKIETL